MNLRGYTRVATSYPRLLRAFFHPDFTVGSGISPDPALHVLAGFTAGRELDVRPHPAPKANFYFQSNYTQRHSHFNPFRNMNYECHPIWVS